MDKRLILSVAGSGKTTYAIEKLNKTDRFMLITYTHNNFDNIQDKVIKKFKCIPENIQIYTYFSFLYSFCFKPYLLKKTNAKGLLFKDCKSRSARGIDQFQDLSSKMMYANRLSKYIKDNAIENVKNRIKKYFDYIIIDEVQDFSAHDFDFIVNLTEIDMNVLFIGDYYQHTYGSSNDGNKNKNLFNKGIQNYISEFKNLKTDSKTLSKSYRCTKSVCNFIRNNIGIDIDSDNNQNSTVDLIEDNSEILSIYNNDEIVKLFYKGYRKYKGNTNNWGLSKGMDSYNDVCVVLNRRTKDLYPDNLQALPEQTKNRLYVAITRSRNNVYFVCEVQLKNLLKNC